MQKIIIGIGSIILASIIGLYIFNVDKKDKKEAVENKDYKNIEYIVEGEQVKLKNGVAETNIVPGSASKKVTRYFGNEVKTDLNKDGREDVVLLLTQETGGSGIFYYIVAALNFENGYSGSRAFFLGDRIAPQATEKSSGKIIIVNYSDRGPKESFSAKPSIGKSVSLIFNPQTMQFGEVVKNFEGEADPSRMSLNMKTWIWISALYNDGREIKPNSTNAFTISFKDGGRFFATTDCNSVAGNYAAFENKINFSQMISTKKYCEGSQESDFISLLGNVQNYHFTSHGKLIFDLKFDSGSVVFR